MYAFALFALVVIVVLGLARARWELDGAALRKGLARGRTRTPLAPYDPGEIKDLPPPVRRYFEAALVSGTRAIAEATLVLEGTMRPSANASLAFASTTRVVTRRPGFLWSARMRVPGEVWVRDAYAAGEGALDVAAAFGMVRLQRLRNREGLPEGQLLRWLAEAPWYPTALLPRFGVTWEPDGESSARATVTDGLVTATLLYRFGADALVSEVFAEARGRLVGGKMVPEPWGGAFAAPKTIGGYVVPTEGRVRWGEAEPYWTGRLVDARYS